MVPLGQRRLKLAVFASIYCPLLNLIVTSSQVLPEVLIPQIELSEPVLIKNTHRASSKVVLSSGSAWQFNVTFMHYTAQLSWVSFQRLWGEMVMAKEFLETIDSMSQIK